MGGIVRAHFFVVMPSLGERIAADHQRPNAPVLRERERKKRREKNGSRCGSELGDEIAHRSPSHSAWEIFPYALTMPSYCTSILINAGGGTAGAN